jgi:DNA-binding transcriptional MocR family regulator
MPATQPINLQSNYPVLAEQDASWLALLHSAVDRFGADSIRLPRFGGSLHNRSLAASWLRMPIERTWIAESGHHALMASLLAAGLTGKTIVVESLTYPWFLRQANMLGNRIVSLPLDEQGIDPAALRDLCQRESIAALYTMPTLHNPVGHVTPLQRRRELVSIAHEFNLTLIEDSAYGFLVPDEPPRYTKLSPERSFYVESLSKRVAPGLRTAFLAAPEALGSQTELALRVLSSGSSTLLASQGCAMAQDGSLAQTIQLKRIQGAERLAKALEILKDFDIAPTHPNSWHLWVKLPKHLTSEQVESQSEANGALITGGHWFTAPDAPAPQAVRVALGGETDWARVAKGLEIFADTLRGKEPTK